MIAIASRADEGGTLLQNLAAELTDAAFHVALRHGVGMNWLDLRLDLWSAMTRTIERRFRSTDSD